MLTAFHSLGSASTRSDCSGPERASQAVPNMNYWQFRGQALVKKDNLAFANTNLPKTMYLLPLHEALAQRLILPPSGDCGGADFSQARGRALDAYEDLAAKQSGPIVLRQILTGDTHSGYLIDLHETEKPAGQTIATPIGVEPASPIEPEANGGPGAGAISRGAAHAV